MKKGFTIRKGNLVDTYSLNKNGKDYVLGDIHGKYDIIDNFLEEIGFNPETDRLFSVGDLVDRGSNSVKSLWYMKQDWFIPVLGNHEKMFLEIYENKMLSEEEAEMVPYIMGNGSEWWAYLNNDVRRELLEQFSKLPIAIEVETDIGTVGIVHAEVPMGYSWQQFKDELNKRDNNIIEHAIWSRSRIRHYKEENDDIHIVNGIDRIFVGHTVLETPKQVGNIFYIDTGSVFRNESNPKNRLTITEINAPPEIILASNPENELDFKSIYHSQQNKDAP